MKNQSFFLTAVAMSTMLAISSCSNDYSGPDIPGNELKVTASINQIHSRVTNTEWEDGDAIGIHDGTMSNNVNVKYNGSSNGVFTPADKHIYVLGSAETTFNAYYPYNVNVTSQNPEIVFDAAAGDNVDFMWATAKATRDNASINLLFSHMMSKISFTITGETSQVGHTMSVSLKGITTAGSFHTATGLITPAASKGTITNQGKVGGAVEFIIPPMPEGAQPIEVNITINVDGTTYQGKFDTTVPASTQSNYSIYLGDADDFNNVTISAATITGWQQSDCGNILVEETVAENVLEIGDFVLSDGQIIDRLTNLTEAQKSSVVGVVYYVGNPQPSQMYPSVYADSYDYLKTEHPDCVNGLAMGLVTPGKGAHFLDVELAGGIGLMSGWMMENNFEGIYGSRYQWIDGEVSASKANTAGENNFLGYNNTRLWMEFAKANNIALEADAFAALYQLQSYAQANPLPGTTSGWYIPSLGEMKTMVVSDGEETPTYSPVEALNASFEKLGDSAFLQKARYWTSTEGRINSDKAQTMAATFFASGAYVNKFSPTNNATTGWYHFSFAF